MNSRTCGHFAGHVREPLAWMSQQLEIVFGELGIAQYLNAFIDQGFDTWETILDITESDLDALGVKLGHRRKLQRRIANSRGLAPDASLISLSQPSADESRSPEASRSEVPRIEARETNTIVITKRKYRRHPKPDENAPERPPSAYVLFSNKMRDELKGRNLTFTEIAKLVGENWQNLSQLEKEPFESEAQAIKDKYHRDLAEYKKTPQYRRYMLYLQEFKAKHATQSQDKDVAKRLKLEPGASSRGSAAATPNRTSRSGSGSEGHRGSEPPIGQQVKLEPAAYVNESPFSVSSTPASYHASPEATMHSPVINGTDRNSAERSPTFSTSPRDVSLMSQGRTSNWADEQRPGQPVMQRHLPSLSDVFESQGLLAHGHPPGEINGYGFPREHVSNSPGPPPGLTGGNLPPANLKREESSAASVSSGSSYGYPRTPLEGPLPIHALLSPRPNPLEGQQQQSYFHGGPMSMEQHKQPFVHQLPNAVGLMTATGYPQPAPSVPHPATTAANHTSDLYAGQAHAVVLPQPRKPDANLDGMSALLKAGEIVNRRMQ